jgi:pre-mRNA-processing factor 8
MSNLEQGIPIPVGSQYNNYAYDPNNEKTHEEKLLEKSRKWTQFQNKRYGEKRKFGKYII